MPSFADGTFAASCCMTWSAVGGDDNEGRSDEVFEQPVAVATISAAMARTAGSREAGMLLDLRRGMIVVT